METSGGKVSWSVGTNQDTSLVIKAWDTFVDPVNGLNLQIGSISNDEENDINKIAQIRVGKLDDEKFIESPYLTADLFKNGDLSFKSGNPTNTTSIKINAKTGDIGITTLGEVAYSASGAQAKLKQGTVAFGVPEIELLKKISETLDKVAEWAGSVGASHTHIGNLAAPTGPPMQVSGYLDLQKSLTTLKLDIETIRGSL